MSNESFIIGLTGGIGSGKSAVCDILLSLNAYIIDADKITKEAGGEIESVIKNHFSQFVEDDKLNRFKLKIAVFKNKKMRKKLNEITHPLILNRIKSQIKDGINIVAVPLLFEASFNKMCNYTLGITANKSTKIERVISRDKTEKSTVLRIMKTQISQKKLQKLCDFIIENDGDLEQLKQKVEVWWEQIKKIVG